MSDALKGAACIGRSETMEGRTADDRALAVSICASCPLSAFTACHDLAQTLYTGGDEIIGVWASTFYEPLDLVHDGEQRARHKPRRLGEPIEGLPHGNGTGRRGGCRCEPCLDYERAKSARRHRQREHAA